VLEADGGGVLEAEGAEVGVLDADGAGVLDLD